MRARVRKLGLGTVQWGMDYGVSNREGRTAPDEVGRILVAAGQAGVEVLDTAALYGESESTLGRQPLSGFRIVTKTPRYARDQITEADVDDLLSVFERSLERLQVPAVYGLLAHHASDLLAPGGDRLINAMLGLQRDGRASRIGVSAYDRAEVEAVLERFTPDIIQLPINVLDQRLQEDGTLDRLKALGVEVHARSVFLQGLLLMSPDTVPAYFSPWRERLLAWQAACAAQDLTPMQAALGFVCDLDAVSCCLVGIQSQEQFEDCVRGLDAAPHFDASGLGCQDVGLLNPVNWRIS